VQLKRFEYDPMTDRMVKINDRFEFSDKLDVSTRRCSPHTRTTCHRSVTRTRMRARTLPDRTNDRNDRFPWGRQKCHNGSGPAPYWALAVPAVKHVRMRCAGRSLA